MRTASVVAVVASLFAIGVVGGRAQTTPVTSPRALLRQAPYLRLTGDVDSNSPALWERLAGRESLFVVTSTAGRPSASVGRRLETLGPSEHVSITPWPGGGIWMESVVADVDGAWYGFYHNENVAAAECGDTTKVMPRIGAARSRDLGRTWEPLGIVLEAPRNAYDCDTSNHYFVGGVGDFSVQLDRESQFLYVFFSQYHPSRWLQGVGVARLAWADRDAPEGKIMVWAGRPWLPASATRPSSEDTAVSWRYPSALPLYPAAESWHDDDLEVDAYWGPSVHWNTYLEQYVMLLNRAKDSTWAQEGIYVSYAAALDDPRLWSRPVKLMDGGGWYPQVMGLETGSGTDKQAGAVARFFVSGISTNYIQFAK